MISLFAPRALLGALACAAALAAPLASAEPAPCTQWNVSQGWYARQGNGIDAMFLLQQRGTLLKGTGTYKSRPVSSVIVAVESGPVTGTVRGDAIELQTSWGGVYKGRIAADGRIAGTTFPKDNPNAAVPWSGDRPVTCMSRTLPRASNDFNGDGNADILWHNAATGEAQVWLMRGASRIGRATLVDGAGQAVHIGPPWHVAGSRDFDSDGKADVLWHNSSTGETQLWFMNGHVLGRRATVVDRAGQAVYIGPPWSIVGTYGVAGERRVGIVWHNSTTGRVQIWLLDRNTIVDRAWVRKDAAAALQIGGDRRIAAVSDVDGDRVPDLVLHNAATGLTQVYALDAQAKVRSRDAVVTKDGGSMAVGAPWRIAGANDFNRDGNADILWHNAATGETQVWFMEGPRILRRASVDAARDGGGALVGQPWTIVSR
jgi:hypothetical protein